MMKLGLAVALFFLSLAVVSPAHADLNVFLNNLNVQAQTDIKGYTVKLSAQFGVPQAQVQTIIQRSSSPADAFMVLQLGHMTNQPPDAVVPVYVRNRDKGWGAIAKELGIKPGSPEFHALKRGDFSLTGRPVAASGHGQGNGHGKGHGRGHGRGNDD